MSMRRSYKNKICQCYIYNLQLIYTFEYKTLYKKIKSCYVTKVVCNMYKLLYILLHVIYDPPPPNALARGFAAN